jgi:hypothetical protein
VDSGEPPESFSAGPEESFRNQTLSGDYRATFADPDTQGEDQVFVSDGFEQGYHADAGSGLDAYPTYPAYQEYEGYPADEGNSLSPNPPAAFAQVYHQPYNQSHEALPAIDENEDPADEAYTYRLEDDERAAYLADYQRTLARDGYSDEPDDEPDSHPEDDAYARAGGYNPTQTLPTPPRWTPPSADRPPISAAPPSWTGVIPTQRTAAAPRTSTPIPVSTAPTPAPRLPVEGPLLERTRIRRQAQRRPAAAARGFVPSQDRIGTAREVMSYLARRPWLQLDVVDIILGTQFDRDDVAHALIVLQQTGRIRSHLRGDRVCYSYAAT